MSEKSSMVKKESLFYALLIGLVIGFISGAIFAVYKLAPAAPHNDPAPIQTAAASNPATLSKQTSDAIANFEAKVTANPQDGAAWTQLGHLYYDSKQSAKAIKAYLKSLEFNPDNADVLTDLGVMYRRNKQPGKAIESFEKAYTVDPKHEHSRLNKGIVLLYDLNKPEEAIATWQELLIVNPQAKLNNGMPLQQAIDKIRKEMK